MKIESVFRGLVFGLALAFLSPSPASADDMSDCEGADYALKIESCTRLIELGKLSDSKLALVYNHRGMAFVMSDALEMAVDDFSEAIQLDSEFAAAYGNRGHAHLFLARFPDALTDFSKAIELNPTDETYTARATVHILTGSLRAARSDLSQALGLNSKNIHALANRAMVNRMMGNTLAAIADYNGVLKLDPDNEDAKRNLEDLMHGPGTGAAAALPGDEKLSKPKTLLLAGSNKLMIVWGN